MTITAGGSDTVVPANSVLNLYDTVTNTNPKNPKTMRIYRPAGVHNTNYVDNAVALEYVIRQANGIDTDLHPITINTSFEYQTLADGSTTAGVVDGWTATSADAGVTRLSASDYAAKFDDTIPDHDQMAVEKKSTAILSIPGDDSSRRHVSSFREGRKSQRQFRSRCISGRLFDGRQQHRGNQRTRLG